MNLPAAPLLDLLERMAARADLPTAQAYAVARLSVSGATWVSVESTGEISPWLADRLALRLGLHPLNIWGDDWLVPWPEDDDQADLEAYRLQRKREGSAAAQRRSRRGESHLERTYQKGPCLKPGHTRNRRADGHCPDCDADARRNRYRRRRGIPLDAPLKAGRPRKETAA